MLENKENKHSFVIYRLPDSSPLHYGEIDRSSAYDKNTSGFIFSQFYNSGLSGFTLINTKEYGSFAELSKTAPILSVKQTKGASTLFKTYKEGFDKIQTHISTTALKKAVLSKRSFTPDINSENAWLLFNSYLERFPNAFVSFVYLANESIWCGASPELFLDNNSNLAHTVALASTRKAANDSKAPNWNTKEIQEQWYVEQFVEDNLNALGMAFSKTKPESIQSGTLWHLKTSYAFSPAFELNEFTEKMHPTPAVGGTPKAIAVPLIKAVEKHDRSYYAGIIGPYNTDNTTHLFVNIRCVEIFSNGAFIYTGGGITAASELNAEWDEANLKADSLNLR